TRARSRKAWRDAARRAPCPARRAARSIRPTDTPPATARIPAARAAHGPEDQGRAATDPAPARASPCRRWRARPRAPAPAAKDSRAIAGRRHRAPPATRSPIQGAPQARPRPPPGGSPAAAASARELLVFDPARNFRIHAEPALLVGL